MLYSKFNALGLCVIPLRSGVPQVAWSRFFEKLPAAEEAATWTGEEYGLVCGKVSGVVALDIDTDDTDLIYLLAGPTPVRKRGSKGFTAFYRYEGQASHSWKEGGKVVCELLSDKRLTTIPPSPHRRTGKPYEWLDQDLGGMELPALSPTFIAMMDVKFPKPVYKPVHARSESMEPVEIAQAEEMLRHVSPDCARDEWVRIGMALRDEYGDAARDLWHRWSAGSPKYDARSAEACWRSFNGHGVGIASLVWAAKQNGWLPPFRPADKAPARPNALKREEKPVQAVGITGMVADWITSTAIRPQPELSLSAALAFMGMVKGHRVRGATNLRTNMLTLSIARSGAGKEYPQYCIDNLSEACGLARNVMSDPTSGTALLKGLQKTGGVSLWVIDEIGRFLSNIALKSAGGYQREIVDYMIRLFSSANRTFRGKQYADENANPQIVIQQPHFCCAGSTVIERFLAACSGTEVVDGFLNRWVVFRSDLRPQKRKGIRFSGPPPALVARIGEWMEANPIKSDIYGNPEPKEMRFTPEAWEIFNEWADRMDKKVDTEPFPLNQLYVRSAEHAEKIAMILSDSDAIGTPEVNAAIAMVNQSNLHVTAISAKLTNSQHEQNVLFVLDVLNDYLRDHPTITKNILTRKTQRLKNRERDEILTQLIESGQLRADKDGKKIVLALASD